MLYLCLDYVSFSRVNFSLPHPLNNTSGQNIMVKFNNYSAGLG